MKKLINILMWIPYINVITGYWNMFTYDKYDYDWFDNSQLRIMLNVLYTAVYFLITIILIVIL